MEKNESYSNEKCNCNKSCCGGKILVALLTLLGVIAAVAACLFSCKTLETAQKTLNLAESSYNLNILSAGGQENFDRMNKVYQSEAYIKYATNQTTQTEEYFGLNDGNTNTIDNPIEEDNSETTVDNTTPNYSLGGDEIKSVVENMLASSPVRGDPNARFTIIEYTELHCPYCQMHTQNGTINAVIEQFPGEVNSISKHFIIHGEDALNLAATMECVAELNPSIYHDLFERAFEAYPIDLTSLINLAIELGTNESSLQTCVDEGRYTQAVNDMMNQGYELFGVNGTPGNVIIDRETGNFKLVSGAYPIDEFVSAINELKNA